MNMFALMLNQKYEQVRVAATLPPAHFGDGLKTEVKFRCVCSGAVTFT